MVGNLVEYGRYFGFVEYNSYSFSNNLQWHTISHIPLKMSASPFAKVLLWRKENLTTYSAESVALYNGLLGRLPVESQPTIKVVYSFTLLAAI